ncbi:MAG: hypothetical protein R2749_13825 [Acidimicrobiales bacterium]
MLLLRHNRCVPAGLHARMVYELWPPSRSACGPAPLAWVVDKYVRRDKPYMVTEYETTGTKPAPSLVRGRFADAFSRDTAPPAGMVRGRSSPRPTTPPSPPSSSRAGRLHASDRFGPVARTLQQRQLDAYRGTAEVDPHRRGLGLGQGVPHHHRPGHDEQRLRGRPADHGGGRGSVAGGRLDVRFLRPVHCGDTITAEATLEGFHAEPDDAWGRVRATFTVAAHNQLGQQTLAGEGSGLCAR